MEKSGEGDDDPIPNDHIVDNLVNHVDHIVDDQIVETDLEDLGDPDLVDSGCVNLNFLSSRVTDSGLAFSKENAFSSDNSYKMSGENSRNDSFFRENAYTISSENNGWGAENNAGNPGVKIPYNDFSYQSDVFHTTEKPRQVINQRQASMNSDLSLKSSPSKSKTARTVTRALVLLCLGGVIQGILVNGLINVVLSSIEKRFKMNSKESAFIASSYDIASFLCLIPVSYMGGRGIGSKPSWIGMGLGMMGVGSLLFSLPHFLTENYDEGETKGELVCNAKSVDTCAVVTQENGVNVYKYVFYLAQFLHGAGATPLYTLGVTYIDELVGPASSAFYLGVFYTMAIVGPAIGYLAGGNLLKIHTDFHSADLSVAQNPEGPSVGAWWVGFVVCGVLSLAIAVPTFFLPSSFPFEASITDDEVCVSRQGSVRSRRGSKSRPGMLPSNKLATVEKQGQSWAEHSFDKNKAEQNFNHMKAENNFNQIKSEQGFSQMNGVDHPKKLSKTDSEMELNAGPLPVGKDLLLAIYTLLTNPTFMFLSVAGACEGFLMTGLATFLPKYIQNQYSLAASNAAIYVGAPVVIGGGGGTLLGGFIVKKLQLKVDGKLKMAVITQLVATLLAMGFFFNCPNQEVIGLDGDSSCGSCDCNLSLKTTAEFDLVCLGGRQYYNPCVAGCNSSLLITQPDGQTSKVYTNCSCANETFAIDADDQAIPGPCDSTCPNLLPFLLFFFMTMLVTFLANMPSLSGTLRCVEAAQRSSALGIQWLIVRLLGTIPGPVAMGTVFDFACAHATVDCEGQSQCQIYRNDSLSKSVLLLVVLCKGLSIGAFIAAIKLYRTPEKEKNGSENERKKPKKLKLED